MIDCLTLRGGLRGGLVSALDSESNGSGSRPGRRAALCSLIFSIFLF